MFKGPGGIFEMVRQEGLINKASICESDIKISKKQSLTPYDLRLLKKGIKS